MKLVSLFYSVFVVVFVACRTASDPERSIPVIHLDPGGKDTLKMSDYFEKVDVVAFNSLCQVSDFYEIGDKYIARLNYSLERDEFHVYDKEGNELYEIGKFGRGPGEHLGSTDGLQCRKDSTLHIINYIKYIVYSLDNRVLREEYLKTNESGLPRPWQDSLIVYQKREYFTGNYAIRARARQIAQHTSILTIWSIPRQKVIQTYFPMKEITGLAVYNHLFEYGDTLCFYHDKNNIIYEIYPDHTRERYYIDKGKYGRPLTQKEIDEMGSNQVSIPRILLYKCNETAAYVIGLYCFKRKFYIFLYDKQSGITRNFTAVDNDLLGLPLKKGMVHLDWAWGLRFKQNYLWGEYNTFMEEMEARKARFSMEEWKAFGEEHPDFVRLYEKELQKREADPNEDGLITEVFWRYHFK